MDIESIILQWISFVENKVGIVGRESEFEVRRPLASTFFTTHTYFFTSPIFNHINYQFFPLKTFSQ